MNNTQALESFIDFCDDMVIINESNTTITDGEIIKKSFFGKPCNFILHAGDYGSDNSVSKQAVIKSIDTFCKNKQLFSYLYSQDKSFFEDCNKDPYFDGKQCNSGEDLINAIKEENTKFDVFVDRGSAWICGEYWMDPEHGFSVNFPGGKFVKGSSRYTADWKIQATGIGQFADAF